MISGRQLHKYPVIRLLLPLIAGIICGDYLFFRGSGLPWMAVIFATGVCAILLFLAHFLIKYSLRWLFGFLLYACILLSGICLSTFHLSGNSHQYPTYKTGYRAVIRSNPEFKERSIMYEAHLTAIYDSIYEGLNKDVLLYFAIDSLSAKLQRGDELLLYAQPYLPVSNGNPDGFDYPRYLTRKGVSATAYIPAGNWKVVGRAALSLSDMAAKCRDKVLELYKQLGFSDDEYAILSALTVGYKDELSPDVRQSFSVAGAAHILALSGLHVSFIYFLLLFVFKRILGRSQAAVVVRSILIIIALWCFAFIVGLSSSVVRAVLMFSLVILSSIRIRKQFTLHSLSVAAFFMLLYNPEWLFDVGFQLSFTAVIGIVLIQPKLYQLIEVSNAVLKYVWGIITVSVAAQIATAPLVLFYFHSFPTHFLLTNLLVIPLVTLIIYSAVAMLLLFPIPVVQQWLAAGLWWFIRGLRLSVEWVQSLPFSSVNHIWLYPADVVLLYLTLLLMVGLTFSFRKRLVVTLLVCMLLIPVHRIATRMSEPPRTDIVFYNVRNSPAVHCISAGGQSWLAMCDSISNPERISKSATSYWSRRNLTTPMHVTSDYHSPSFIRRDNIVSFAGKRICILADDRWHNKFSENPMDIDCLYICNGYSHNIESMLEVFNVGQVILDASLPAYKRERYKAECARLNIACTSLSDGAFVVSC